MMTFVFGVFIGGAVGFMVAAILQAGKEDDDGT